MIRQAERRGPMANGLKFGVMTLLTLEVAFVMRSALTHQSLLIPITAFVLTCPLAFIFVAAGLKRRVILQRLAFSAGVQAFLWGIGYVIVRLNMASVPHVHWMQNELDMGPFDVMIGLFALAAWASSFVIGEKQ